MIGTTQLYIILAIAVLLFGGTLVSKGVRSFYQTKRDIKKVIDEENAKETQVISSN